jgi:TolB-like protein/DNA-binding winged helix-turn-helix (wHTH) protein/Tfp pilus assembly protein PilF
MGSSGPVSGNLIKFGDGFELDLRAYELRRSGQSLKLERIPMELLRLLLEHPGQLVTREQIVERIWGKEVFVDTDNSINAAIRKVRQVLEDDSEQPRFVQTVTGMGYRFIAPVYTKGESPVEGPTDETATPLTDPILSQFDSAREKSRPRRWGTVLAIAIVLVVLAGAYFRWFRPRVRSQALIRTMIAVLPFENLTGDANQDYFCDGLTEEMITQLGQLDAERMGVIGRTSVMHYKHKPEALDKIGRELGVQYVLEGSVRRASDRVRITAQLLQVKDQTHLWAQEYDRDLKDLLVLQGEIARRISDEIQVALGDQKPIQPQGQAPLSPQSYEAYDLYLKGQYFWNKRTTEGFQRAIDYFQQAIAKDPNYARAYAGLADSYALIGGYSIAPQTEFMPKARAAASRAVELDDNLPEAHTAWALIVQNYDWDWQTAEKEYRQAIELNPNYATAHHWYAEHLALLGHFDEALRESERARQLEPLSLIIAADKGVILYYSRQYDRAIEQFHAVQDLDPNFPRSGMIRQVYAQKGMFAEMLAEHDKRRPDVGAAFWIWSERAYIFGRIGQRAKANKEIAKMEEWNRRHPVDPELFVAAYIGMGDKDQAFAWLEKAYTQHSNVVIKLRVDPLYDPLRSDPRFQDLLRRVGLAQ